METAAKANLDKPDTSKLVADDNGVIQIFLSHKHSDAVVVRKVCKKLNEFGQGRLEVFASSSSIKPAEGWRSEVWNAVQKANCVILLFTDPDVDWTWCLYECGYFEGFFNSDKSRRLFVIHDKDTPAPAALDEFQWTAAARDDRQAVRTLIHELVGSIDAEKTGPNDKPDLARDRERRALENSIIEAVCLDRRGQGFEREITVQVKERSFRRVGPNNIPNDSRVYGNQAGLSLVELSVNPKGHAWNSFYSHLDNNSDATKEWVKALTDLMWRIGIEESCPNSTGLPIFRSRQGDSVQSYRPIIRSFKKSRELLSYSIIFADLPPVITGKGPAEMNLLVQGQSLSRMFRWSVLAPLQRNLERLPPVGVEPSRELVQQLGNDLRQALERFGRGINAASVEASNLGYDHDEFLSLFNYDQRKKMEGWTVEWKEIAEQLLTAAEKNPDEALSELPLIHACVAKALSINARFMRVCTLRYLAALRRYAPVSDETA